MNTSPATTPAAVWATALGELERQMTKATFNTWLKDTRFLRQEGNAFVIGVRNTYAKDWLENRLVDTIERTLRAINGDPVQVQFVLSEIVDSEAEVVENPGNRPDGRSWEKAISSYAEQQTAVATQISLRNLRKLQTQWDGRRLLVWADDKTLLNLDRADAAWIDKVQAALMLHSGSRVNLKLTQAHSSNGAVAENGVNDSSDNKLGRPYKLSVPGPPDGLGPDQVFIDVVERDPMRAHLRTPHYAKRFWQPYLGMIPFNLWEVLRSYYYFVKHHNADWPTITLIVETMGYGTRHTLLGRKAVVDEATGEVKRKAQEGAVSVLEQNGILIHKESDPGSRQTMHYFTRVIEDLPLLTPKQVAQLSPLKQAAHTKFLEYYEFDYAAWARIEQDSLLLDGILATSLNGYTQH